jgi:hypothetical protein
MTSGYQCPLVSATCLGLQKDNDVHLRKATLLKLNGVEVGIGGNQLSIIDVFNEGLQLGSEDVLHQLSMVRGSLALKECFLDLRPGRVGSHGDEKVSSNSSG